MRHLWSGLTILVSLIPCDTASAQGRVEVPWPDHFELGLYTFFDFGPPFDFYQLYFVRPTDSGTKVERVILTPAANKCFAPAKLEPASATLSESVRELLGPRNPCAIPDKELKREMKRCKKCAAYSGAKMAMQVQCGGVTRLIRSDILDRDMFDPAAHTPENTAWTMQLLEKLDKQLGPGAMEKPMFAEPTAQQEPASKIEANRASDMEQGKYDALFPSGSTKLSGLYRQTQEPAPPVPTAKLKSELSVTPVALIEPSYPPLARMTHTEGDVTVSF